MVVPIAQGLGRGHPISQSDNAMPWRPYFVAAALMIVFAFAHILALQRLNAMQNENPAAVGRLAD